MIRFFLVVVTFIIGHALLEEMLWKYGLKKPIVEDTEEIRLMTDVFGVGAKRMNFSSIQDHLSRLDKILNDKDKRTISSEETQRRLYIRELLEASDITPASCSKARVEKLKSIISFVGHGHYENLEIYLQECKRRQVEMCLNR